MNHSLLLFEEDPETPVGDEHTTAYRYRNRILKLRTADQRRAALQSITNPDTRAAVRFYIEDHFARLHHRPLPDLATIQIEEGARVVRRTACKPALP